jgi:hypothetical protein
MKDRLTDFLKLSKILNLIPILPKLSLADFHTTKKNNLLEDYIEIPEFVCREMPLNYNEILFWNATNCLINEELYNKYKYEIQNYNLNLKFLEKYRFIASEIIKEFKTPICIVHVRRGDYLNLINSLNYTTSSKNIINILKKYEFNDCYIKTNEKDLTFFDELKKNVNVKFYTDFPILKSIYDNGDNYALYSIECCMRDLCDIRISTFNTTKSELCWLPNNDSNYFNDYLDTHFGYQ